MAQSAWAEGPDGAAAINTRKIITWVAPYALSASNVRLQAFYPNVGPTDAFHVAAGPRNAINHLALQFWVPKAAGGAARSKRYGTISDARIQSYVTWAHRYSIKVLLCVYNGEFGWNWPLAKAGFLTYRTKFIDDLIAEMDAQGLDGIDVDLEGVGEFEADKPAYIAFIAELARRVHLKGKIVTVDSFPYIWNAPNQNWWATIFPLVDGINSMGYEDLGLRAPGWQSYPNQKAKAGIYAAKLQIGIPSYLNSWQNNTIGAQTNWFRSAAAGRVGIAIWDAQFSATGWNQAAPWQVLRAVKLTP